MKAKGRTVWRSLRLLLLAIIMNIKTSEPDNDPLIQYNRARRRTHEGIRGPNRHRENLEFASLTKLRLYQGKWKATKGPECGGSPHHPHCIESADFFKSRVGESADPVFFFLNLARPYTYHIYIYRRQGDAGLRWVAET